MSIRGNENMPRRQHVSYWRLSRLLMVLTTVSAHATLNGQTFTSRSARNMFKKALREVSRKRKVYRDLPDMVPRPPGTSNLRYHISH